MYFEEKWNFSFLPWCERYDVIDHVIKFVFTGVKNSLKLVHCLISEHRQTSKSPNLYFYILLVFPDHFSSFHTNAVKRRHFTLTQFLGIILMEYSHNKSYSLQLVSHQCKCQVQRQGSIFTQLMVSTWAMQEYVLRGRGVPEGRGGEAHIISNVHCWNNH